MNPGSLHGNAFMFCIFIYSFIPNADRLTFPLTARRSNLLCGLHFYTARGSILCVCVFVLVRVCVKGCVGVVVDMHTPRHVCARGVCMSSELCRCVCD